MSSEAEANRHLKKAGKALKTNFLAFRCAPDFEEAAQEYKAAAQCFAVLGQHEKATAALKEFAQVRRKEGDLFGAGRGYEDVAKSYQGQLKDYKSTCGALEEAAECYVLAGKIDSSCRIWSKIADIRENELKDYIQASNAFAKCIELHELNDKDHNIADVLKMYVKFLARHLKEEEETFYPLLVKVLDQQTNVQAKVNHAQSFPITCLCKVVLRLYRNDTLAASSDLNAAASLQPSCLQAKEYHAAIKLLVAWDTGHASQVEEILKSSQITYLPVEFAKLARALQPPKQAINRLPEEMRKKFAPEGESESESESRGGEERSEEDAADLLL